LAWANPGNGSPASANHPHAQATCTTRMLRNRSLVANRRCSGVMSPTTSLSSLSSIVLYPREGQRRRSEVGDVSRDAVRPTQLVDVPGEVAIGGDRVPAD